MRPVLSWVSNSKPMLLCGRWVLFSYREAVEKLRRKCPEVNYSTDIPKYIQYTTQLPDLPMESLRDRIDRI